MSFITGREIIIAAGKAATWRTAVDVNAATKGLLIKSESLGAKAPQFQDDDSLGNPDILFTYKTLESAAGSLEAYARYEGLDLLFALALGTAGTPTQGDGTAYYNTYSPADEIAGLFATLAMKKAGTSHGVWEIPSAKIHGFTIKGQVGQLCTVTFNLMGNKVETTSPVNTSLASVTPKTKGNVIKFDTLTRFRMNAQSGAALANSDAIYPFSFEITYNRPHEDNFEASYQDASEPVQSGFADASIRLTFDKYNIDTFTDAIEADTDQKMDIEFLGDTITGAWRYAMRFDLPKVKWRSAESPVSGPGKIPHNLEGRLLAVAAAPTGMTATDPISIYVQNTVSADPLT